MKQSVAAFLIAAAAISPAFGQSVPVFQTGLVRPNDLSKYVRDGQVRDAVGLSGDNNGMGVNPFAVTDFQQPGFSSNSALTTGPYQQLTFGHTATKHRIEARGMAGAPAEPLEICANGTCLDFPFTIGGILGPPTTIPGNLAVWGNSIGTQLVDGGSIGPFAGAYGADPTGATDSTAAVQSCLNAAGVGQTCRVNGVIKLLSSVSIPAGTTFDCGVQSAAGLTASAAATLLTGPRILLDPAHRILFGGTSATLQNCVVVPNGMTFPQVSSNSWSGTAIDTNGASAPQIINVAVGGFDTCINTLTNGISLRPYLKRVWYDCNGVTNGGSLMTGSSGDLATLNDVAGQVLVTRFDNCDRVRQGVGMLVKGATWGDRIIVQDYQDTQVRLQDAGVFAVSHLWTDFVAPLGCPPGTSKGLVINNFQDVSIKHSDINGTQTGVVISNQGVYKTVHFGNVLLNVIGGDGIVLGAASGTHDQRTAGVVQIDMLNTNETGINVGGFALNYLDNSVADNGVDALTGNSTLIINGGLLIGVHGGAAPFLSFPVTTDAARIRISPALNSPLAPANGLYGSPTITCTGMGTGGHCDILGVSRSSPWNVSIIFSPGTGAANTGQVNLTWPLSSAFPSCVSSLIGSTWVQPASATLALQQGGNTASLVWAQPSALVSPQFYGVNINCVVS